MIVWVFFLGGAGGDGLANLLEQATNAVPLDGNKQWRIHRYVDYKVKFWAPNLQNTSQRINTVDQLNDQQLKIALSDDQYLIITSHDVELKNTFSENTVPTDRHIKILLKIKDRREEIAAFNFKNLIEFDPSIDDRRSLPINPLDFTLQLDQVTDNWEDFKKITDIIGLDLPQAAFDHYKKIVSGQLRYTTPGIGYYESFIDADNITKYLKIN